MSLDRLCSVETLLRASRRAARGKRGRPEAAAWLMDAERHALRLADALRRPPGTPGAWVPAVPRTRWIRDPKPRRIAVVPFEDRVVHHALCEQLVPALERSAIADSWACRDGKGALGALRRAQGFARGARWAMKLDVARFFASVRPEIAGRLLRRRVDDRHVRAWLLAVVATGGGGLPIGSLVSQHLANGVLGEIDHLVKDRLGYRRYLRYMDDMAFFGEREELLGVRAEVAERLQALGLVINPRSSGLWRIAQGLPFLGWVVTGRGVRPSRRARVRWARLVRRLEGLPEAESAPRLLAATAALSFFPTFRYRRGVLRRVGGAAGLYRGEPPAPPSLRRLLEDRPGQAAGRQPQQEPPGQRQEQQGLPPRPLGSPARRGRDNPAPRGRDNPAPRGRDDSAREGTSDAARLRVGGLHRGADPAGRPGSPAPRSQRLPREAQVRPTLAGEPPSPTERNG